MMYIEADDRCVKCKKLLLTGHEIFLFWHSPKDIELQPDIQEWQPSIEEEPIPFDNGPHRAAYVWTYRDGPTGSDHVGKPVIQVHEGPLADVLWRPCCWVTLEPSPGVWLWVCQPMTPKNAITDDWMRSISS